MKTEDALRALRSRAEERLAALNDAAPVARHADDVAELVERAHLAGTLATLDTLSLLVGTASPFLMVRPADAPVVGRDS